MPRDFKKERKELRGAGHPIWGQKWAEFQFKRIAEGKGISEACPTCGFADPGTIRGFVEWLLEEERKVKNV